MGRSRDRGGSLVALVRPACLRSQGRARRKRGNPRRDLASTPQSHDLGTIRPLKHAPTMPQMGAKRMDQHRVTPREHVPPRLDVSVPEHLSRSHAPPRAAEEPRQLNHERQVQPDDDVGSSRDEVTDFTLAEFVDDPARSMVERRVNRLADLLRRRPRPVRFVLNPIHLDERHSQQLREPQPECRLSGSAAPYDGDPAWGHDLYDSCRAVDFPSPVPSPVRGYMIPERDGRQRGLSEAAAG